MFNHATPELKNPAAIVNWILSPHSCILPLYLENFGASQRCYKMGNKESKAVRNEEVKEVGNKEVKAQKR